MMSLAFSQQQQQQQQQQQHGGGSRHAPSTLLLVLLLLLVPAASAAAGIVFPQYPVDWSLVPNSPERSANLSASCICALLNGTCTPGCCCDAACPADLVSSFRAARACLPEGPPPEQLTYCLPEEPFAQINLPQGDFYRLQRKAADVDFLTQLLCVTADRSPSLGKSFPDPPAGDVSSNAAEALCPPEPLPSVAGSAAAYAYGQALVVQGDIPPAAASVRVRGTFVLPVGVLSSECLDLQQVGFMSRLPHSLKTPASSCTRTFASAAALSAACADATSPLSPTYWAGLRFPPTPSSTSLSPVSLMSLTRVSLATGAMTVLDPATDLAAPAAAAGPPAMCSGVVVAAHFLLRSAADPESGALSLASAQLTLVVADVAMPAAGPLVVATAFSVNWADVYVPDGALQPLSGAPGYLPGFPLLAGLAATAPGTTDPAATRTAVLRLRHGLQLPGAGPAGRCSPSPAHAPAIGFGYNLSSSCSIGLTLGQLRTLCQANDATKPLIDIMGADWLGNLTAGQVLLGMWGNAEPANIHQWLPLTTTDWPPTADLAWDEATATCHNVASGLQARLLTGVAFASGNLQSKLLYASACFKHTSWRYDRLNGPPLQTFPLTFSAQFVPKAGQAAMVALKPAPPLSKPLPPDLFYPFSVTSGADPQGARRGGGWGPRQWLLMAVGLWVALAAGTVQL